MNILWIWDVDNCRIFFHITCYIDMPKILNLPESVLWVRLNGFDIFKVLSRLHLYPVSERVL